MSIWIQGAGLRSSAVVRWLSAPIASHPEVRDELIATVIQRRPAVFISCAAIMIMSISAALLTEHVWAVAWLIADTTLISYRLYLSFRHDDGISNPSRARGAVVASMLLLFLIFGLGCSLCIMTGPPTLMLMAIISVLGVFAGIASRWAVFPRLALLTILAIALPVCTAVTLRADGGLALAAVQFAAVAVMTASQTAQNHRTLMRMILAEHQNAVMARSDPLTGLGNRIGLREDLDARRYGVPARASAGRRTAVLYLDLDGFKAFNDTHGHDAGDALLKQVGQAISKVAEGAGVYRIGGDEFVLICGDRDERSTVELAQHIVQQVSSTRLRDEVVSGGVGVSIGIAFVDQAEGPDAVLARADEALYAAKRAGKARCYMAEANAPVRALAA